MMSGWIVAPHGIIKRYLINGDDCPGTRMDGCMLCRARRIRAWKDRYGNAINEVVEEVAEDTGASAKKNCGCEEVGSEECEGIQRNIRPSNDQELKGAAQILPRSVRKGNDRRTLA